jgi:hypothetical protein
MQRREIIDSTTDEAFLLPRKYINVPKSMTNLDNFKKDVLHGTVFENDGSRIP